MSPILVFHLCTIKRTHGEKNFGSIPGTGKWHPLATWWMIVYLYQSTFLIFYQRFFRLENCFLCIDVCIFFSFHRHSWNCRTNGPTRPSRITRLVSNQWFFYLYIPACKILFRCWPRLWRKYIESPTKHNCRLGKLERMGVWNNVDKH